jgi:hypothetical protein
MFPTECVPISGHFQAGFFTTSGYAQMVRPPMTTPEQENEMRNMNRGECYRMKCRKPLRKPSRKERQSMGKDGSVKDSIAMHLFVISISQEDIQPKVKGGGVDVHVTRNRK